MAEEQINKPIGPSFESEWRAAGLTGDGFSWSPSAVYISASMKAADVAKLKAVIAAHNYNNQPPTPVERYDLRTSKVAFFRRCSDDEAAQFTADLADASPRLKAIFDSVTYLIPGTDEYPDLRSAVEARVGAARADGLLAPSND